MALFAQLKRNRIRHGRYMVFLGLLVVLSPLFGMAMPLDYSLALGFDVAAAVFILSAIGLWCEGAPGTIRTQALRDDGRRVTLLLVTIVILFSVLVTVASLIVRKADLTLLDIAFVVATLVIAWLFANLVYAFHYARLFYDSGVDGGDHGGLDFPGDEPPCFADFVNFAFVVGMTCQTADIDITRASVRRAATIHGVVAFFFNLGVLALTVNVVASTL